MKKIYLIGSLRNPKVPNMAMALRDRGFDVFDDWYGAGNEADDKWQDYENLRGRKYRDALAGHAAQHIFNFDKKHIEAADAVMLVLPAGKSGHIEFGYARGLGKAAVIFLDGEPDRFDVMYNFANLVTNDIEEAAAFVKDWQGGFAPLPRDNTARIHNDLTHVRAAADNYLTALATIAHSDAQSGEDAVRIRSIAMQFFRRIKGNPQ